MIAFAGDEELSLRRWLKGPTRAMDPASLVLGVALVSCAAFLRKTFSRQSRAVT